jgi:hypothetical protein
VPANSLLPFPQLLNYLLTVIITEVSKSIKNVAIVTAVRIASSLNPVSYSSSTGIYAFPETVLKDELSGLTSMPRLSSIPEWELPSRLERATRIFGFLKFLFFQSRMPSNNRFQRRKSGQ